jgi:diacylglycerol kinase family enzyme
VQQANWWYRLVAWVALGLIGLAGVVGLYLVLSHPLLALAYVLTAAMAVGVGWRLLMARGRGQVWWLVAGLAVLLVALAIETWEFLAKGNRVWALVLMVALVLGGVGLAAGLRRRYRQSLPGPGLQTVAAGRPFLIVNPKSGDGRAIKAHIPELASQLGVEVLELNPGGSLVGLVQQAIDGGATVLGISGGDGSIGLVAGAAMEHDLPLVVLPGGTRCHFARDIGLDPEQIVDSLRCFGGREVLVDAAEINGRVFVNNASFGLYADIVDQPGYRERKLQSSMEVLSRLSDEGGSYPLKFKDGSGHRHRRAVAVLVGVNRYETLNVAELGERLRLDEGVLQITAVLRLESSLLKQLSKAMKLAQLAEQKPDDMTQWVSPEFELAVDGAAVKAGLDGELVELDSPIRLRILPGRLRLMVPPEGLQPRKNVKRSLENLKGFALKGTLPHG